MQLNSELRQHVKSRITLHTADLLGRALSGIMLNAANASNGVVVDALMTMALPRPAPSAPFKHSNVARTKRGRSKVANCMVDEKREMKNEDDQPWGRSFRGLIYPNTRKALLKSSRPLKCDDAGRGGGIGARDSGVGYGGGGADGGGVGCGGGGAGAPNRVIMTGILVDAHLAGTMPTWQAPCPLGKSQCPLGKSQCPLGIAINGN
ncbi:hypothetical protein BD779DRAFT_1477004 [Infundibulicybe gibba]|nr:hypothetical protein BD779DRAFT_1477004 [Infundibulicybe gibba]